MREGDEGKTREGGRERERERERERKREGEKEKRERVGLIIICRFHFWPPTVLYLNKITYMLREILNLKVHSATSSCCHSLQLSLSLHTPVKRRSVTTHHNVSQRGRAPSRMSTCGTGIRPCTFITATALV